MLGGGSRWGRKEELPQHEAASFGRGCDDSLRRSSGSRRSPPPALRFAGSCSGLLSFLLIKDSLSELSAAVMSWVLRYEIKFKLIRNLSQEYELPHQWKWLQVQVWMPCSN